VSYPCIFAHDLGATGNKAALFDAEGSTVVVSAFESPFGNSSLGG
jgi:sugar (pentulose or hexulose) kinase